MAAGGKQGKLVKIDETTVQFQFENPYFLFPSMLAGDTLIVSGIRKGTLGYRIARSGAAFTATQALAAVASGLIGQGFYNGCFAFPETGNHFAFGFKLGFVAVCTGNVQHALAQEAVPLGGQRRVRDPVQHHEAHLGVAHGGLVNVRDHGVVLNRGDAHACLVEPAADELDIAEHLADEPGVPVPGPAPGR